MDPTHNYDECVEIETARCKVRDACKGNAEFDKSYKDFDVKTCIAYSKEHCRTRKIEGDDWDQGDVDKCVAAIMSLEKDCSRLIPRGIDETEEIGQCNFIENGDAGLIDLTPEESDPDTGAPDGGIDTAVDKTEADAGS